MATKSVRILAGGDSPSDGHVKTPRRDGMDDVPAVPNLTSSDLAGSRIPRRDVIFPMSMLS